MRDKQMIEHMEEKCQLAAVFAKDGAWHTAAQILLDLAPQLKRHARERDKLLREMTRYA